MEATMMRQPAALLKQPVKPVFKVSSGVTRQSHVSVLYGTGGIGKTSLAAAAPGVLFVDLEGSTRDIDTRRVDGIETWADLRSFIQSGDFANVKTLAIDTGTAAEELCRKHVLANVGLGKGKTATSLEDYGFGKGYVHLFEEWRRLLADLDNHRRQGRNVVMICHERIGKVPNPNGDDYIRYEPRLYSDRNVSLMLATKEWADHVLFVAYDVIASEGKARGSGTRTIYTAETATYMAKSRTLPPVPIVFERGSNQLWNLINQRAVSAAPEL